MGLKDENYDDDLNDGECIGVPPSRAVCTFCGQFIALSSRGAKINVCPRCNQHTMATKCINGDCQEKIPYPFEGRSCLACGQNLFIAGISLVQEHIEPTAEERKELTEKRDQHWVDEVKQQAIEEFQKQQEKAGSLFKQVLASPPHHHDCPQCGAPCFDAGTFCAKCNENMGEEEGPNAALKEAIGAEFYEITVNEDGTISKVEPKEEVPTEEKHDDSQEIQE